MITKSLTKKEVLEAVIIAMSESFPKDKDGYLGAKFNKTNGIDLFYYRNSEQN